MVNFPVVVLQVVDETPSESLMSSKMKYKDSGVFAGTIAPEWHLDSIQSLRTLEKYIFFRDGTYLTFEEV